MPLRLLALVLLLAGSAEIAPQGVLGVSHVSIRANGPAISVTGGAEEVSATLHGRAGAALDGLVIERTGRRTSIVLAAVVEVGARIEVRVPTSTNLSVEGSNGGAVIVRGVRGQLEVVNSNAGIVLDRVAGTVLASTSNGSIEATLQSVDPALPLSFLTSNGAIDVTFPADLRANVRMESDTGPMATDFELVGIGAQPIERRMMRGGRFRTIRQGAINGGGPEITLRTENAPITIRKPRQNN
jgi:DUF4097 and DUF4098 domain-containing protein YvlB